MFNIYKGDFNIRINYVANFNFFDNIDTPQKAYWLGFIWADGYISKRERIVTNSKKNKTRLEYNLKLALKESDASHVQKFINDIDGNYPVHIYNSSGFDRNNTTTEARAFITNKYMCSKLYEDYGIIPRRHEVDKIIRAIPERLYKYFILGVFDGDGSFTSYHCGRDCKLNVCFGGSEELLRFIENVLITQNVVSSIGENKHRKLQERHKGRDGTWRTLPFAGVSQGSKILRWLYEDSVIYLDRKYEKYKKLASQNFRAQ